MPDKLTRCCSVLTLVALLLVAASVCSAGELVITGIVVTPDGQPGAGATVFTLWGFVPQPGRLDMVKADTTTDATGRFTLRIEGKGEPYLGDELTVVATMEGHGLGWTFAPPTTPTGLRIALRESGAATGVVVDDAGKPIRGATVAAANVYQEGDKAIVPLFEYVQTTTDDAGHFRLPGLPRGVTVYLQASALGYRRAQLDPRPVDRPIDEVFTLHRATSISGRITSDGEPAQGVYVTADRQGVGHATGSGGSGPDGVYTISGIPPGTYAVSIYWLASGDATLGRTATAYPSVKCDIDAPATGVDFELIEGGLVTGTIRNARTNEPLAAASVIAYESQSGFPLGGSWQAVTSADGVYTLRLPPGTYLLQGQASGYQHPGQDPSVPGVTVEAGRKVKGPDIVLTPTPRIAGTVVDADGKPAAGVAVRTGQDYGRETVTDAEGRFDLGVIQFGGPTEICVVDTERGLVARLSFTEETTDARIVLEPGAVATGQVVDPGGKGLGGLSVAASYIAPVANRFGALAEVRLPATRTDAEGRFRLPWLPHDVELTIYVDGEDGRFISERKWTKSVTLPQGEELDLGPTVLDRAGQTLAGRVMDADRNPVPDCTVVDWGTGTIAKTDGVGRFELAGLPLLSNAGAVDQRYRPNLVTTHPEEPLFCGASVVDPARGYELDMILEPPGKVRGCIVDTEGKPAGGVLIYLTAAHSAGHVEWPDAIAAHANTITVGSDMRSRDDGTWEFDGLVPGVEYVVHVMPGRTGPMPAFEHFMPIPGGTVDLGDVGGKQDN